MTDEEYKAIVVRIGQAFKELPNDQARLDVLCSLTGIMKIRASTQGGLLTEWMEQAHGTLKACMMIWKQ